MVMMLGWKNWLDAQDFTAATITGGSWSSSWPLTNARTRRLVEVAKSADALTASTKMIIDLGATRAFDLLTFVGINWGATATVNVKGAATQASLAAAPSLTGTTLAWVSPQTPTNTDLYKPECILVMPTQQSFRWLEVDIADTGNADGHVEVEHVGVWLGYRPPHNFDIGASSGINSNTAVSEGIGMAEYFFERANNRMKQFGISFVDDDEADEWMDVQRYCDISKPVFFVHDTSEPTRWIRRCYLARIRVLTNTEFPAPTWRGIGAEIKEWVA